MPRYNVLAGEPPPIEPGHYVPGRGGEASSTWNVNLGGLSPMFNALLGRYGQAMDYQLQDMARMPGRNELAFRDWLTKRQFEREATAFGANEQAQAQQFGEQQALRAEKVAQEARMRQQDEERKRLLAAVGGNQQMHQTYGPPVGFNPNQTLNDFYSYNRNG